jgi:hypothetical protein
VLIVSAALGLAVSRNLAVMGWYILLNLFIGLATGSYLLLFRDTTDHATKHKGKSEHREDWRLPE